MVAGRIDAERERLERLSDLLQGFAGMPLTFGDNGRTWRRAMGYADYLAAGDAVVREYLADTLENMAPAFFDDIQQWEHAEQQGAIPYVPD